MFLKSRKTEKRSLTFNNIRYKLTSKYLRYILTLPIDVVQSLEDNLSFSPRQDSNIHMDELHSDLSFVRGTEEEKSQYLIKEEDKLQKIFGESYSPRVKLSSFYSALVAPPVPSKRTRHQNTVVNSAHVSNEKLNATSTENKDKEPTYRERSPSRKTSTSVETDSSGDSEPSVSLPLSSTLSNPRKLNTKDKEKEYWRRQRRVFVHSRFLTNEEGVQVAKSVYSNLSISPSNRMIISFQGNIGNFRTKLRRIFDNYTNSFNITKDFLLKDESFQEQYIQQRVKKKKKKHLKMEIWSLTLM